MIYTNPLSCFSEYYLYQGLFNNDMLQFSNAIDYFNKAIELDSSNRLTYLARAYANFELGNFDLALQDYEAARYLSIHPPSF